MPFDQTFQRIALYRGGCVSHWQPAFQTFHLPLHPHLPSRIHNSWRRMQKEIILSGELLKNLLSVLKGENIFFLSHLCSLAIFLKFLYNCFPLKRWVKCPSRRWLHKCSLLRSDSPSATVTLTCPLWEEPAAARIIPSDWNCHLADFPAGRRALWRPPPVLLSSGWRLLPAPFCRKGDVHVALVSQFLCGRRLGY